MLNSPLVHCPSRNPNYNYNSTVTMIETERNALVEKLLPRIRRLAKLLARRAGRGFSAEDLAQVGAVILLEQIESYNEERGSLWGYCGPRVYGGMVDAVRRDWREESHAELDPTDALEEDLDLKIRVSRALDKLTPEERRMVRMVIEGRETRRAAANRLRVSEQYAGKLLKRGLVALRKELAA